MRLACAALVVLCACRRAEPLAPVVGGEVVPPQVDVDAGTVRIAAVGDISPDELGHQVETAGLVLDGGYDAVLLLGDTQYPAGAIDDYRKYFDPTWGRLLDKLHPVPGNHEYVTAGAAGYFEYFGARAADPKRGYYSFDVGAWHLIALNTNSGCKAVPCDAASEQVKWLRDDLRAHRNRCTLAYFHHPRLSSGIAHGDFTQADAIWQTLAQYGADVVLNGHEHFYERFEPVNGLTEFIVGTGGVGHYEMKPIAREHSVARDTAAYGVLELTLRPGRYEWRFVAAPGSTFSDSGSAACR